MKELKKIPTWILVVSAILALMEIGVSILLFISPESVAENIDLQAKGVQNIIYMWATRQFALGFILAFASLRRSAPMLTIAYIFFLVMMLGDLIMGISQNENELIISALVMIAIAAGLLVVINKKNK